MRPDDTEPQLMYRQEGVPRVSGEVVSGLSEKVGVGGSEGIHVQCKVGLVGGETKGSKET